jgi:IS4 transposase
VLAEVMVTIGTDEQGIPVPAKIVFVRDRRAKKWLALLATDTSLTAAEIIALYGRRWDIEVFFKMAKSFLNLAKEFQSRSFDALVAHATLVCCRYIILELAKSFLPITRDSGKKCHSGSFVRFPKEVTSVSDNHWPKPFIFCSPVTQSLKERFRSSVIF